MKKQILITGPPKCGKSTLISKLINYYSEYNYIIYGFLTPEFKENGKRLGFDVVDIYSGSISKLARIGDFGTGYKVGKYNVFVEKFDSYLENSLNLEGKNVDLIIIDEIGKMELYSKKFQNFINKVFFSNIPILATIGSKLNHPLKNYLLNLPSILLLNLNRQNFQLIFEKVISLIP
jgi:nucleoside-triphosphatase THEP1